MKKLFILFIIAFFFVPSPMAVFDSPHTIVLGGAQEVYAGPIDDLKTWLGTQWDKIATSVSEQILAAAVDLFRIIVLAISDLLFGLFGFILYIAGLALDIVITLTVLKMADVIGGGSLPVIEQGWTILRDIANIGFIFILVYIAIATILELSLNTGKALRNVIVVALLINFSLFFTQVIIDASNALTTNFYQEIQESNDAETISAAAMTKLKLTTVYSGPTDTGPDLSDTKSVYNIVTRTVAGIFLILATAIVFYAMAILLLVRFVVLIFLMILAPIAFMGAIIPKLNGMSKKWWGSLMSNAIFPPVMFLFLYIALEMAESIDGALSAATGQTPNVFVSQEVSAIGMQAVMGLISFLIVIAFLVGSIVLAKMAGASGSAGAIGLGSAAVFGSMGAIGRRGGRFAGSRLQNSRLVQKNLDSDSKIVRGAARLGLKTGDKIKRGTYDLRNSKTITGAAGALGGAMGTKIDLGKGVSRKDLDKKAKDKATFEKKNYAPSAGYKATEEKRLKKQEEEYQNAKSAASQSGYATKLNQEAAGFRSQMTKTDANITNVKTTVAQRESAVNELQAKVSEAKQKLETMPETEGKRVMERFVEDNEAKLSQLKQKAVEEGKRLEELEKEKEALARQAQEKEAEAERFVDNRTKSQKSAIEDQRSYVAKLNEKGETEDEARKRIAKEKGIEKGQVTKADLEDKNTGRKKTMAELRQEKYVEDVKAGPLGKYSFLVGKTERGRVDEAESVRSALKTDDTKKLIDQIKKSGKDEDSDDSKPEKEPKKDISKEE